MNLGCSSRNGPLPLAALATRLCALPLALIVLLGVLLGGAARADKGPTPAAVALARSAAPLLTKSALHRAAWGAVKKDELRAWLLDNADALGKVWKDAYAAGKK